MVAVTTSAEDYPPSFEERIVELQEFKDEHGHLCVGGYTGGRTKDLGAWVKGVRDVYKQCLSKTTLLDKECPWILLGSCKLSKLRIERLEAMGFEWSINAPWEKRFQELVAFKVSVFSARHRNTIIISSNTLTRAFY
jgi:hypothetical protein